MHRARKTKTKRDQEKLSCKLGTEGALDVLASFEHLTKKCLANGEEK